VTEPQIGLNTGYRADMAYLRAQLWQPSTLVLSLSAVLLTLQYYWGNRTLLRKLLTPYGLTGTSLEMAESLGWCLLIVLLYLVIPALVVKFAFRERLRDYGLGWGGLHRHWHFYVGVLAAMLPVVIGAARTPYFQQTYPFYDYVSASLFGFLLWQAAYGLQFLAVEFFFRGFLLFGLRPTFGVHALLIGMAPYCMIHFQKPMGEALGAIVAGFLLNYLALKNRSIWGGAFLHWMIALTMDAAAIFFRGGFGA
jgi:membrane protease YdiL (CAAX protease family)